MQVCKLVFQSWLAACWGFAAVAAWAVEVDGRIGADEWQSARHINLFRMESMPAEARVVAAPESLALAIPNSQSHCPGLLPVTCSHRFEK